MLRFEKQKQSPVEYEPDDKLQVDIRLYLKGRPLEIHYVDNRLKDCLDALQSRFGGSKKIRKFQPIIHNDNQIYRVVIEKGLPPKQAHGLGHLIIRRYKPRGIR